MQGEQRVSSITIEAELLPFSGTNLAFTAILLENRFCRLLFGIRITNTPVVWPSYTTIALSPLLSQKRVVYYQTKHWIQAFMKTIIIISATKTTNYWP